MPAAANAPFVLDARLAADTHLIGDLPLSRLLLMDDTRFPWLIFVPRAAGLRELTDLPGERQHELLDEIAHGSRVLRELHAPHKLNVAALGNVVAQLHVHLIARFEHDAAWPRPVWGVGERAPYTPTARDAASSRLRAAFGLAAP